MAGLGPEATNSFHRPKVESIQGRGYVSLPNTRSLT